MRRSLVLAPLALSVGAFIFAGPAFHESRQARTPSVADIQVAGVKEFTASGNKLTPAQVLELLGKPTEVYRNNPRALCWRYDAPYEVKMCWGPKRKQAWIATNIPLRRA